VHCVLRIIDCRACQHGICDCVLGRDVLVQQIAVASKGYYPATLTPLQALLPPHFKLSSALDPLHPLSHAHKAGMRSTTGGKGAGASGPTTSQLPPVPDHLDTQVLPGG
jgi:hypothetical protein